MTSTSTSTPTPTPTSTSTASATTSASAGSASPTDSVQTFVRRHFGSFLRAGGMRQDPDPASVAILGQPIDRLSSFGPAVLAIRWGTTAVSLALAVPAFLEPDLSIVLWCAVLLGYTAFRTVTPLRYTGDTRSLIRVLGEVLLCTTAVTATGLWSSPLVFSLITTIIVAGFARGFSFALRVSLVSSVAVTIPELTKTDIDHRSAAQWTVTLLLVALVAGYARRISGEADRAHSLALDRLSRLADANALLFSLHRVTQTLPASLDYQEVLDSTVERLRGLLDYEAAVLLLLDETDGTWLVVRRDGARLPERLMSSELPPPLQIVVDRGATVSAPNLVRDRGPGLVPTMGSGIYAPLPARGSLVGLLAVEHSEPSHFTSREVELVNGFVEPAALAIDNARWFNRLRTVGADEERTRIARDLHDRIGQSLAYLAFELDRIVTMNGKGEDVGGSLQQLRNDVRGVIGEVRDTLYDLRTDVSDNLDLPSVLEAYIERVRARSGLEIALHADRGNRLPILQEREMWRIAQEAIANVERHARARRVRVLWRCNGRSAALEVADDGVGFPEGQAGRLDSYGILGMRERASSIGATLDIITSPGKGTRVRCYLAQV